MHSPAQQQRQKDYAVKEKENQGGVMASETTVSIGADGKGAPKQAEGKEGMLEGFAELVLGS